MMENASLTVRRVFKYCARKVTLQPFIYRKILEITTLRFLVVSYVFFVIKKTNMRQLHSLLTFMMTATFATTLSKLYHMPTKTQ